MIGLRPAEFWAQSVWEWLATLDGWASQYPDSQTTEPPTRQEAAEAVAALSDDQRRWLGYVQ